MSGQPSDWAALARLIAGRDDILRVAGDDGFRAQPWPDAQPDRPYAVHLYDRAGRAAKVLALDLDAKTPSGVAGVRRDLANIERVLSGVGLRYAVAASGPAGGRHVLVPFEDGIPYRAAMAVATWFAVGCPTLDTSPVSNSVTGALRPPGAPHTAGGTSTIVSGLDAFADQNSTRELRELLIRVEAEPILAERAKPLPEHLYRMLRHGEGVDLYKSMSEATMALAVSVISRGASPGWLARQLVHHENKFATLLATTPKRDGTRRDVEHLIAVTLRQAETFVAVRPPVSNNADMTELLDKIERAASTTRWAGTGGLSAAAVLAAHIAVARRCGSLTHNVSQRELCELAAIGSRDTIRRAQLLLQKLGWLRFEKANQAIESHTWKLRLPSPRLGIAGMSDRPQVPLDPLGHQVFAWRQLGKAAARVLAALELGPASINELADRTGLCEGTIRRSAAKLYTAGLLARSRTARGWRLELAVQPEPAANPTFSRWSNALERLSEMLGANEWLARMRERHEWERMIYRAFVLDVEADRAARKAAKAAKDPPALAAA